MSKEPNSVNVATSKPTDKQAQEAIRTLIRWIGENPDREGLIDTPERVVESYKEFFAGYNQNPQEILSRFFEEVEDYNEMIILRDIRIESYCEHHLVPIIGKAAIAYVPENRVVGISKLARVIDAFAKRLQIQERLTAQIANVIDEVLLPKGVAVVINSNHQCMSTRGVHKVEASMITSHMTGIFKNNTEARKEFFSLLSLNN